MTGDQIALDLIKKWESKEYKSKGQQKAALQCLIIEALEKAYSMGALDTETANNQKLGFYK